MGSLTRDIGTFISSCGRNTIPAACREAASVGMTDCVAVMIAGADEPAAKDS